jgi:hypothetical protein
MIETRWRRPLAKNSGVGKLPKAKAEAKERRQARFRSLARNTSRMSLKLGRRSRDFRTIQKNSWMVFRWRWGQRASSQSRSRCQAVARYRLSLATRTSAAAASLSPMQYRSAASRRYRSRSSRDSISAGVGCPAPTGRVRLHGRVFSGSNFPLGITACSTSVALRSMASNDKSCIIQHSRQTPKTLAVAGLLIAGVVSSSAPTCFLTGTSAPQTHSRCERTRS